MRKGRKTTRGGRFLAIVLAMAMVLQQAGITTLADDGATLAAETTMTEATTEAAESNSEDTSNETTAAAGSSSTTTDAVSTEASTTTETAVDTDAADTSDADVTADESTDPSASSDSETTPELSIEETDSDETTTEDDSEEAAETATEAAAEAESESEAETEDVTEAAAEAADAETEADTEAEDETEAEEPKTSFTYSDSDVVITATAAEEANFPQGTELAADYIDPDSEEYAAAYLAAVSAIETQLGTQLGIDEENTQTAYVLYDVYFVCDGVRVEPEAGSVSVSMVFRQAVELGLEGEITNKAVVHIQDSGVAEIVTDFVNVNADGDMTAMSFTQSSFSYTGAVVTGETAAAETETEEETEEIAETEEETEAAAEAEEDTEATAEAEEETEAAVEAEEETETDTETVETEEETEIETEEETEAPKTSFAYEDERVIISAVATEEANLPQDAELKADYLEPGSDEYNAAVAAFNAQLSTELGADDENVVVEYTLYDIYFLCTSTGERIEPEKGSVTVTMDFITPVATEAEGEVISTEVVHLKNDGGAEIVTDYVETNSDGEIASVIFTQESFSIDGTANTILLTSNGSSDTVDLEDITSSITVTSVSSVNDVSRTGTLKIAVSYTIADSMLSAAKEATAWTYDLSDLLSSNGGFFSSIDKDGSGFIFNGSAVVGTYTITDGIVTFVIDSDWLANQDTNVQGTFDFYCSLDSSSIGTSESETISFPGSSDPITINFEDVEVTAQKTVKGSSDAGKVLMKSDGTIEYVVQVTPNADLTTLTLTDTLGSGQSIVGDTVYVYSSTDGTKHAVTVSVDSSGKFTVNVADVMGTISADTTYYVSYNVTVDDSGWGTSLTNNASWSWDGSNTTDTNTTTITPYKDVSTKAVEVSEENGETYYTYTITIGDGTTNLAGYTITDVISQNQELVSGSIVMTSNKGGMYTIVADTSTLSLSTGSNDTAQLFSYTFSTTRSWTSIYTITYKTKLSTGSLTDTISVTNKLDTNHNDGAPGETDSTSKTVTLPSSAPEISKSGSADWDTGVITWTISVYLPDGTELDMARILDRSIIASGQDTGITYYSLGMSDINWDNLVITGVTSGKTYAQGDTIENYSQEYQTDYSSDEYTYHIVKNYNNNGSIVIFGLDESITITFTTTIDSSTLSNLKSISEGIEITNTAELYDGWTYKGKDSAIVYYTPEYQLSKTGSYNSSTGIITWTIKVNADQQTLASDFDAYVYDVIPAGMTYVSGSFNYEVNENGTKISVSDTNANVTVQPDGTTTLSVKLGSYNGNYYYCQYQTTVDNDEIDASKDYTNKVYLKDETGTEKAEFESTVTVKRTYVTKSGSDASTDLITYTVIANPEALDLSASGNTLTLTDTLPSEVELAKGGLGNNVTVSFTDKSGNEVIGCSYTYLNNELTVTIPDETYVKIQFAVMVIEIGTYTLQNNVVLSGDIDYTASTSKYYNIVGHSATIGGDRNSVVVRKYNATLSQTLPNAGFTLYSVNYNSSTGEITGRTPVGAEVFTANNGEATFTGLNYGQLYYIVETTAPDGYEISDTGHYFAIYNEDENVTKSDLSATLAVVSSYNNINISIVYGPYSFEVTDTVSEKATASLQVEKVLNGNGKPDTVPNIFTFKLEAISTTVSGMDVADIPMPAVNEVTNNESRVTFGSITYDTAGVYVYKITETDVESGNPQYSVNSTDAIYAKVTVRYDLTQSKYVEEVEYYTDENLTTTSKTDSPTITNEYDGETSVSITKVWSDDSSAKRPSTDSDKIAFTLYKVENGNLVEVTGATATITDNSDDTWTVSWTNL
ncbi:MAG: hypothetical protein LUI14_01125, partial [Lachnospiraceae bacterium]|nr:hypothetical protein [Lachnospiraceae bacterium]